MTTFTRETYVNATTNTQFGVGDWEESYTDNRGKLFKFLSREYGRCISKMYRDLADRVTTEGSAKWHAQPVGWVFQKRMRYEDARRSLDTGRYSEKDYYIREVWVEVRDTPLCARCGKDEDAHHEFVVAAPDKNEMSA